MTENGDWESDSFPESNEEIKTDLPPEYCHYKDEGCELAVSCLNCHLAQCVHDEPGGKQRCLKRFRNREIVRLFSEEQKGVPELAQMFHLCERTIQRALKSTPYREVTANKGEVSG
ncbi:hypothetical protein ACFLXH_06265 [Chloroflexota bacterium]